MEAYAAAKARVFGSTALMVLNRDDPPVEAMLPRAAGAGQGQGQGRSAARRVLRFGLDAPQRPGDFGLVVEQRHGLAGARAAGRRDASSASAGDDAGDLHLQRLMPADALRIRGRHNAANALAALALATRHRLPAGADAARPARIPRRAAPRGSRSASVGGVEAFDDSKGTNVGATVAALRRPGRRQGAGQAGRDPRRRRQGPGLRAAGRAGGALRARGGADRPRRGGDRGRAGRHAACRCSATPRCRGRRRAGASRRRAPGDAVLLSARPAPAWTCSATTATAPRSSSLRCRRWRTNAGRRWHERPAHAARKARRLVRWRCAGPHGRGGAAGARPGRTIAPPPGAAWPASTRRWSGSRSALLVCWAW